MTDALTLDMVLFLDVTSVTMIPVKTGSKESPRGLVSQRS